MLHFTEYLTEYMCKYRLFEKLLRITVIGHNNMIHLKLNVRINDTHPAELQLQSGHISLGQPISKKKNQTHSKVKHWVITPSILV